ncbi:ATP-binding cassette sub-family A member 1 [Schistosoma japonicum]|uniref:ATP-binding cassette sub-family A member 1 n=1 Tax=Schistosoma japonicum TaxID=6182 RepID=A0A4Z2CWB6_SCHJA|nr:ATP-binding cassette sub-family A member 1 [Schistosoma japonicum]
MTWKPDCKLATHSYIIGWISSIHRFKYKYTLPIILYYNSRMKDLHYPHTNISMSKFKTFFTHYQLLMWKNLLLRRRRPGFLIAEILVPLIIPIILVGIRTESPPINENTCHVRSVNLPTMGLFSYIQSIFCNFLYRCHPVDPDINLHQYNYTVFDNLLENVSSIVGDLLVKNITNDFRHFNVRNFLQFINNPNGQTIQRLINVMSNLQQIYRDIVNELSTNDNGTKKIVTQRDNDLHNKTIDLGTFSITGKQIQWLSNLSRFFCGTKSADSNDIGKLMEILKEVDFSSIIDIENKLKRIRRNDPSLSSTSNDFESMEDVYKVNCVAIDSLLRNSLLIRYTGRIRFLLNGYILYHPVNNWTNEIIYRAMEPQRLLILLRDTLKQYQMQTKPILAHFLSNTSMLLQIQNILRSCALRNDSGLSENLKSYCLKAWSWLSSDMNIPFNQTNTLSNQPKIFNQLNVIIDIIIQLLECFPLGTHIYGINNQSTFNLYMELYKSQVHPVVQGILFNHTSNNKYNYTKDTSTIVTIRQSPFLIDETNDFKVLDRIWHPGPRNDVRGGDAKYFTSGFLDMQDLISNAIIELSNNLPERIQRFINYPWNSSLHLSTASLLIGKQMKFFPTKCYTKDIFLSKISKLLPQLLLLTWVLTAMLTTKLIVEEKETHLREFTKIMGFSNTIHWLCWFNATFFIALPISMVITLILKYGNILILSNIFIIFTLFISYIISIMMFCFLCSTCFQQANLSAIVTGLVYFMIYIPTPLILANEENVSETIIFITSLSNQVAFSLGLYSITRSESQGFGSQWHDLWQPKFSDSLFSPGKSLLMLWIDSVIYLCSALLIELFILRKYNIRQLLYAKLKCQGLISLKKIDNETKHSTDNFVNGVNADFQPCVESNSECLPVSIIVQNVSKIYSGQVKSALNQLNVNFYANQITSLLGHNGAGKSTLISILTGMHKPTKGSAFICGHDILNHMDEIRTNLGFCPQHNILFEYLTVIEHIQFYAQLKGFNKEQVDNEVKYFTKLLALTDKLHDQVKNLSGGQKRKLSVAIAFVGRASVILLDEPTTGVDPYSRRSIWDLILKAKLNKTIIITTHHMDEADILGDRIGIISQGKLKCCGSSLFLKSNYGQGYYLILERQNQLLDETFAEGVHTEFLTEEDFQQINDYLKQFIKDISLINYNQNEIVFRIPMHNITDGSLSQMFQKFRKPKMLNESMKIPDELFSKGIINFGLTDTSLEEIFLAIADDPAMSSPNSFLQLWENDNQCETDENKKYSLMNEQNFTYSILRKSQMNCLRQSYRLLHLTDGGQIPTPPTLLSLLNRKHYYRITRPQTMVLKSNEIPLNSLSSEIVQLNRSKTGQQIKAMLIKRLHCGKRSKLSIFIEFILPICVLILALASSQLFTITSLYQPMIINPWLLSDVRSKFPLNTFYENNLYELEDPLEGLVNKSEIFKSVLNIAWDYENALKKPYGWTGIGCLPTQTLEYAKMYYKMFGQCDRSNVKLIKNELTRLEMKSVRSSQITQCYCKTSCSGDNFTTFKQQKQPSSRVLATSDVFVNLTSFNVSDYLLRTQNQYIRQRYGGLSYHALNYPSFRTVSQHLLHPNNPFVLYLSNATGIYDTRNNLQKPDTFWSNLVTILRLSLPPISYFRIWFNNKGYVAAPAYLNVLHNLQLRMLSNNQVGLENRNNSHSIIFVNHPLSIPKEHFSLGIPTELLFDLTLSLFTLLSLSLIPASFITFLVKENQTGSKYLQFVSGLNPFIYWLSAYLWDIMNYTICAFLCILVFVIFQKTAYIHSDVICPFILLILFYGLAIIPMLYISTFCIRSPSTALVMMSIFNLLLGSITVMCTLILDDFSKNNDSLKVINNMLKIIFTIFPQYCLSRGLFDLAGRCYTMKLMQQLRINTPKSLNIYRSTNPYDWNLLGSKLCALPIEACLFLLFVLLKEKNFFIHSIKHYFYVNYPKLSQKHNITLIKKLIRIKSDSNNDNTHINSIEEDMNTDSEDEDVRAEKFRILKADKSGQINSLCSVAVINLTKFFPLKKKPSVNRLTFGVRPAECFGLLGVNGAGKTTTFNMITGKLHPSMGTVYVNGYNVVTQTKDAHKSLGYCPQFDAVHDLLTGRETLSLYARLRGIPEKQIPVTVTELLQNMGLTPYANQIASAYSGGNRRKLSTAVAIIGKPQVILLDEPTSGMDPVGRRFMWDQIIALVKEGRSVILTTHSMEECEALCQRIGIMINGQMKCFGSLQHLKHRFGNGYRVEIRLNHLATDNEVDKFKNEFHSKFPNSILNELRVRYYEYQMDKDVHLSLLFTFLNEMQTNHIIQYYSVKQTTLDHVFVNFSRDQLHDLENTNQEKSK